MIEAKLSVGIASRNPLDFNQRPAPGRARAGSELADGDRSPMVTAGAPALGPERGPERPLRSVSVDPGRRGPFSTRSRTRIARAGGPQSGCGLAGVGRRGRWARHRFATATPTRRLGGPAGPKPATAVAFKLKLFAGLTRNCRPGP